MKKELGCCGVGALVHRHTIRHVAVPTTGGVISLPAPSLALLVFEDCEPCTLLQAACRPRLCAGQGGEMKSWHRVSPYVPDLARGLCTELQSIGMRSSCHVRSQAPLVPPKQWKVVLSWLPGECIVVWAEPGHLRKVGARRVTSLHTAASCCPCSKLDCTQVYCAALHHS